MLCRFQFLVLLFQLNLVDVQLLHKATQTFSIGIIDIDTVKHALKYL